MSILQNLINIVQDCDVAELIKSRNYKPGMLFVAKNDFYSLNTNIDLEHAIKINDICLFCEENTEKIEVFGQSKIYTNMKFLSYNKFFNISTFSLVAHRLKENNTIEIFDNYFEKVECSRVIR
jgi:hypothetical protein